MSDGSHLSLGNFLNFLRVFQKREKNNKKRRRAVRKGKGAPIFCGVATQIWAARLVRSAGRLWLVLVVDWAILHSSQLDSGQRHYTTDSEASPIPWTANKRGKCHRVFDAYKGWTLLTVYLFCPPPRQFPEKWKCWHTHLQSFQPVTEWLLSNVIECKYLWAFMVLLVFFKL